MDTAQKTQNDACGARPSFALPSPLPPLVFLLLMLLASCRTAPPLMPRVEEEEVFIPMEPGGVAYIFIDVENSRHILDGLSFRGLDTGDRQFRRILDSTGSAMAAVYASGEGEPAGTRFRLAAQGRYPSGRARMAMRCSRHWRGRRSQTSGGRYWYSTEAMISIAMGRNAAFVSTSLCGAPVDPFYSGPGTLVPEGFDRFRAGAIVSSWMDNPGAFINQRLADMHIPLEIPAEQLFVILFPVPRKPSPEENPAGAQGYAAHVRVRVASELQARGFATVLALARALFSPPPAGDPPAGGSAATAIAAILFANPTVAEGRYLHIRTDPMEASEISLLIGSFLP